MKNTKILSVIAAALALGACSKEAVQPSGAGAPVNFTLAMDGFTPGAGSRAADLNTPNYPIADYMAVGSGFDRIDITAGEATAVYIYEEGALTTPDEPLCFPGDASALALSAVWPSEGAAVPPGALDQTTKKAFLTNDKLTWSRTMAPTVSEVTILFKHANPKVTFVLGGQYAGRKITALEIDGYQAYCDPSAAIKCAQLMIPAASAAAFQAVPTMGFVTIEGVGVKSFIPAAEISLPTDANSNYTLTINL